MEQNKLRVRVLVFGILTDITGVCELYLPFVSNTGDLNRLLYEKFPKLSDVKYAIAVDNCIVNSVAPISSNSEIALLPPFSGG